jgi:hypothetical protein
VTVATVEAFEKAAELGLKLGLKEPDKLTFEPVSRCPREFIEVLKLHKQNLIALLRMPFVMVRSRTLDNEILFFCADESTKTFLVLSGASQSSIYTKAELQLLIEQNRVAPISADELCKLHEIKKTFNAKIRE